MTPADRSGWSYGSEVIRTASICLCVNAGGLWRMFTHAEGPRSSAERPGPEGRAATQVTSGRECPNQV